MPRIRAFRHTNHEEVVEEGAKPEREPDVYTIPRSMWARVEAAHDARRKVARQLPGKHPVWVSTDNNGEKKIVVEQYDDGNLRSADVQVLDKLVPSWVKGVAGANSRFEQELDISVDIERPRVDTTENTGEINGLDTSRDVDTFSHNGGDFHYRYEWNDVPAGACTFFGGDYNGSIEISIGTTGFPVYHDGDKHMITAGHNWDWDDSQTNLDAEGEVGR